MKILFTLIIASIFVTNASAAIFHGIFTGTVDNLSEFSPFNNGDSFTLRFEVDTVSTATLFAGLDIGGVTGTFGDSIIIIFDNESGTQDRFQMVSALDSPVGIFDGKPNSNIGLEFIGGTSIFNGTDLAQPFFDESFSTVSGSFDVNSAEYFGDLIITDGVYLSGSLPPVPLPATLWLFGSGLLGLIGVARRKFRLHLQQ